MNIKGHFETITRHKLLVMKYCFECGLYDSIYINAVFQIIQCI